MNDRRHRPKWIIWYAICLHIVYGSALLWDDSVRHITAIDTAWRLLPNQYWLAGVYLVAAAQASFGLRLDLERRGGALRLMLLQQFVLMVSCFGAIEAMWLSQFADGVIRPRAFLVTDQMPSVLAAGLHTATLWEIWTEGIWTSRHQP